MFSYIVTGVILVYNSFIILICVFAVYGAYSAFRELFSLLSKDKGFYIAVKASEYDDIQAAMGDAKCITQKCGQFCSQPIILCDTENMDEYKEYGFDIYIKSGKESYGTGEPNQRKR